MRLLTGRRPTTVDYVVAGALTFTAQIEIWAPQLAPGVGEVTGPRPLLALTTLAMTLPLAARRSAPVLVLGTVLLAAAIQQVVTTPTEGLSMVAALLVAAYSASAYSSPGKAAAGGVMTVVGSAFIGSDIGDRVFVELLLGAAWLMGFVVAQRSQQVAVLADDNRALGQRLTEAAALLADAERRLASETVAPAPDELAALTARELDVVRAIARGLSNGEIAAELVISEWTVKTHVASILRKLGLRDRAQVVVAAYESGLIEPGGYGGPTRARRTVSNGSNDSHESRRHNGRRTRSNRMKVGPDREVPPRSMSP